MIDNVFLTMKKEYLITPFLQMCAWIKLCQNIYLRSKEKIFTAIK